MTTTVDQELLYVARQEEYRHKQYSHDQEDIAVKLAVDARLYKLRQACYPRMIDNRRKATQLQLKLIKKYFKT